MGIKSGRTGTMSIATSGGTLRERGLFGKLACLEIVGIPTGTLSRVFGGKLDRLEIVGIPTGTGSSGSGVAGLEEVKFGGGRNCGRWSSELELSAPLE